MERSCTDQTHSVVISGYDGFAGYIGKFVDHIGGGCSSLDRVLAAIKGHTGFGSIATNNYVTAAATPDGSLAIPYLPMVWTVTVDMSKFGGSIQAHWYDPTNGKYSKLEGASFANVGSKDFIPPGNNSAGDGDWVLVLEGDKQITQH